ncbi:MAG TPA: hypothetical protein VHU23_17375 [Rhizomicrobium sp.]|jgi:hypothetical protein|nr:hypothetical protein [Rhizomicrobium sp.]
MPRSKSISDEEILDRALGVMTRAGPAFTLADIARDAGIAPHYAVTTFRRQADAYRAGLYPGQCAFFALAGESASGNGRKRGHQYL